MPRPAKRPTGGDHQQPYPHLLFGHLTRAVEAHLALTIPPDERDNEQETDEGGTDGIRA